MRTFSARTFLLAALALAIVAAGCGTAIPDPNNGTPFPETDWCYYFNFAADDYGATVSQGAWTDGVGFYGNLVSGWYELSLSYTNTQIVQPAVIEVTVARHSGVTGDIDFGGDFNIFGLASGFSQTLPSIVPSQALRLYPSSSTVTGSSASVSWRSSDLLDLVSLMVWGNGVNPFPFNSCEDISPTQDFLTGTATPSETATQTNTPTATPTCVASYPYDFWWGLASGNGGPTFPNPSTIVGTVTIDEGSFRSTGTNDNPAGIYDNGPTAPWGGGFSQIDFTWHLPELVWVDDIEFIVGGSRQGTGDFNANTEYYLYLDGSLVQQGNPRRNGLDNYTFHYTPSARYVETIRVVVNQNMDGVSSSTFSNMRIHSPCGGMAQTYTPTPSPSPTETWFLSPTPTTQPTSSRTPIIVASRTATLTPGTPTNTSVPAATATWFPTQTLVPFPTALPTHTGGEDNEDIFDRLGEIGDSIGNFFAWIVNAVNAFFAWLGGIGDWIGGHIANLIAFIENAWNAFWSIVQQFLAFIRELWDILQLLLAIARHLIEIFILWLQQLIALVQTILATWNSTFPTPIPGLPYCVSAPMDSDVCAIFYIADNTIFSGFLGAAIMLVIIILIDLGTIFYFLRKVMQLLHRGEGVTKT